MESIKSKSIIKKNNFHFWGLRENRKLQSTESNTNKMAQLSPVFSIFRIPTEETEPKRKRKKKKKNSEDKQVISKQWGESSKIQENQQ